MRRDSGGPGGGAGVLHPTLLSAEADALLSSLAELEPVQFGERAALEAITALERVQCAAEAAQARLSVRVDEQARARQRAAGVRSERLGQGVGAQIALARRESPHRGARHLGLAKTLVRELPRTLDAMVRGEWQATLVAQTVREVARLAYASEPGSVVKRHAQAVSARHVTLRPAPDTMCCLTALLPVVQGVAAYASLVREADLVRAAGDPEGRGRGQVMADTLVERLTGQVAAPDVPVEVELVMPVDALLGRSHAPAHLVGFGPLPAAQARSLVRDTRAEVWLRRIFTQPRTGRNVTMDSRRELFEGELRHLVVLRDQFCRTPWCDAPIVHADHPRPRRDHGPTDEENAQGLCEACNYAKEAPGWRAEARHTPTGHVVATTTPTGERYTSPAPDPPGG